MKNSLASWAACATGGVALTALVCIAAIALHGGPERIDAPRDEPEVETHLRFVYVPPTDQAIRPAPAPIEAEPDIAQ